MKKITLLCLVCGMMASCSVNNPGFIYQESVNDNVMTVNAKSGQPVSGNENMIILEQPSVTVVRTKTGEQISTEYSAQHGRLNKRAKILTLTDDVHSKSSNGNTITADRIDIKL